MSPVTGCLTPALSNGFNLDRIYWTVGTVSVPVCTGWQERVQLVRQNLPPALPRLVAPAWTQARHATAIQVYKLCLDQVCQNFSGPIPDMQYIVTGSVVARFSRYFARYPVQLKHLESNPDMQPIFGQAFGSLLCRMKALRNPRKSSRKRAGDPLFLPDQYN